MVEALLILRAYAAPDALLNQYSPVTRARTSIAGEDATRPVGARAQIHEGLRTGFTKPNVQEIVHKGSMRSYPLQRSLGRIKYELHFLNRHWLDI